MEYSCECIESGAETEMVTNESILTVLRTVIAAKASLAEGEVKAL